MSKLLYIGNQGGLSLLLSLVEDNYFNYLDLKNITIYYMHWIKIKMLVYNFCFENS